MVDLLLLESGDKLLQENVDGILLDESPVNFQDVAQLNVGNMIAVVSINLGGFKVLTDALWNDTTTRTAFDTLNVLIGK